MHTYYLGLGSNMGERLAHLRAAVAVLEAQGLPVSEASCVYETSPVNVPAPQGDYLNAVIAIQTECPPPAIVGTCLEVERELGRTRNEYHAARVIDLDVLLCGDTVCDDPHATVPHPRLHERLFVLTPLRELGCDVRHQRLDATVEDLYQRCVRSSSETVRLFAPPAALLPALVH